MSFIYDDHQLIDKLINYGRDFQKKYAQVNPDLANLNLLISNLEKNLPEAFDPTKVLDKIPKIINPQFPSTPGEVPITGLDLENAQTLNNWLDRNSIALIKDNRQLMSNHPEFDRKLILQFLNARGSYLLEKATNDELKNNYKYYLSKVNELSGSTEKDSDQKTKLEPKVLPARFIEQLSQTLPFNNSSIEFSQIRNFLNKYKQLAEANQDESQQKRANNIFNSIQQAEESMDIASGHTKTGMQSFPMNINVGPAQVKSWVKTPEGQHYLPLLDHLSTVLTSTYNLVRDLSAIYGKHLDAANLREQESIFNKQFNALRVLQENVR